MQDRSGQATLWDDLSALRTCEWCDVKYESVRKNQKYCSPTCSDLAYRARKRSREQAKRSCEKCGVVIGLPGRRVCDDCKARKPVGVRYGACADCGKRLKSGDRGRVPSRCKRCTGKRKYARRKKSSSYAESQKRKRENWKPSRRCQGGCGKWEAFKAGGWCWTCRDNQSTDVWWKCPECLYAGFLTRYQKRKSTVPQHRCQDWQATPLRWCADDDCDRWLPPGRRTWCSDGCYRPSDKAKARQSALRARYIMDRYYSDELFRTAMIVQAQARRAARGGFTRNEIALKWLARGEYYGWCCYLCGVELDRDAPARSERALEWEHVKPKAAGGHPWLPANIRPACYPCNRDKGDLWEGVGVASGGC